MTIRVRLSNVIYPRKCLEEAVAAYSNFCVVETTAGTSSAREIKIACLKDDAEQCDENLLAHEFLNYLLDLSLEHHIKTV
jgi:hypothetical protein